MHEAMTDLFHLMQSLVDSSGRILVDGIYDQVAPVTQREDELTTAAAADFDLEAYKVRASQPPLQSDQTANSASAGIGPQTRISWNRSADPRQPSTRFSHQLPILMWVADVGS